MNDWDYFFTGTFDKEKVGDRKDLEKLKSQHWNFLKISQKNMESNIY